MMRREMWRWTLFLAAALLVTASGPVGAGSDKPMTFGEPMIPGSTNDPNAKDNGPRFEELVAPGKTISLDFQNAQIHTILRSFSEVGGVNIVASPDVKGRSTVTLKDVPWSTALRAS